MANIVVVGAAAAIVLAAAPALASKAKSDHKPTFQECQKQAIATGHKGRGWAVNRPGAEGFMAQCMRGGY